MPFVLPCGGPALAEAQGHALGVVDRARPRDLWLPCGVDSQLPWCDLGSRQLHAAHGRGGRARQLPSEGSDSDPSDLGSPVSGHRGRRGPMGSEDTTKGRIKRVELSRSDEAAEHLQARDQRKEPSEDSRRCARCSSPRCWVVVDHASAAARPARGVHGLASVWVKSGTPAPIGSRLIVVPLGVVYGFYSFEIVLFLFARMLGGRGSFSWQPAR